MAPRLSRAARLLLLRQRDLIADWQAESVGLSRRTLLRALDDGWRQHGLRVFSARDTDATPAQMRVIGALEAGPDAMLTGRAALTEAGWSLGDDDYVDVLVPREARGMRRRGLPWLRLHYPGVLPRSTGIPPRAPNPYSVIDAASWSRSPRQSMLIVVSSAQQGLASPARLKRELDGRRQVPHRRWIQDALTDLVGGAQSTHEADFLRECRKRGLPVPRMQRRRVGTGGKHWRTDAEFVRADGRLVIVEIDGVGHLAVESWHEDLARHNDLAMTTGALILRVTGWEVRNDPDPFFRVLVAVLHDVVIDPAV